MVNRALTEPLVKEDPLQGQANSRFQLMNGLAQGNQRMMEQTH